MINYHSTLSDNSTLTYSSVVSIFFAVPSIVLQYDDANLVMICSRSWGCSIKFTWTAMSIMRCNGTGT